MDKPKVTLYMGQCGAGKSYYLQHLILNMISPLMKKSQEESEHLSVFAGVDWPDLSYSSIPNFVMKRSAVDVTHNEMLVEWISYIEELRQEEGIKTVVFDDVLDLSVFQEIYEHANETFHFIVSAEYIDETLFDWMSENVDEYMIGKLSQPDEKRLVTLFDDNLSLDAIIAYSKRDADIRFFRLPSVAELRNDGRILNSKFYWNSKTAILWWNPGIQQYEWRRA